MPRSPEEETQHQNVLLHRLQTEIAATIIAERAGKERSYEIAEAVLLKFNTTQSEYIVCPRSLIFLPDGFDLQLHFEQRMPS
jgi:hypothetical protein